MKKQSILILAFIFTLFACQENAQKDFLKESWKRQVKPIENKYLTFSFNEKLNELEHSFYPWQQTNYQLSGQVWSGSNKFAKEDTLRNGQHISNSKTIMNKSEMLLFDFGDKKLFQVTKEMFKNQTFKTARYVPSRILNYFLSKKTAIDKESNEQFAIYKTTINKTIVKLYIDKSSCLLAKITTLNDDDLFGDVLTTYTYLNYIQINDLSLALNIKIKKIDGKILDEVHLNNAKFTDKIPKILERPSDYKLIDALLVKTEVETKKYNNNIHFIELKHTNDKVMLVEFLDFLLVAEAPLKSKNGELIFKEIKKIVPNKPIRYFVSGHYHPHYLGGIRPFVHRGAKIIASKQDQEYVSYIVKAKHTLNPDSLQLEPKPLVFEEIKNSLTISDKKTEMKIYFIGEKSEHTRDYLIYYFPKEKLLFEDDLVWIPRKGKVKKAGLR